MMKPIGIQGVFIRFIAALILVFCSYNPEEMSYYHWAILEFPAYTVLKIFLGVILLIGWTIFIRATLRSLGPIGLILAAGFFGTLLWLIVDYGLVPADSVRAISYIVLVILAAVLTTGMSWSHIRRRLSGQADMDDVDEN